MANMKTTFVLGLGGRHGVESEMSLMIRRYRTDDRPFVVLNNPNGRNGYVKDKDLERFAINILKSIKSKHYKP